ncbi:MAG: ATP-binding cassette domain-containing protein, partial [Desulfobacterales bacterium]|nr:ATP-binding cassette domain-containing protein [Desulfobacterales bacterium]
MPELIRSESISKHFGMRQVLSNISFSVDPGEILGIIGPNGAGKTTLMECMSGLLPFDKGEIYWKNQPLSPLQSRRFMFYLP